ncbi:hypothetical protein vseg_013645 [Gypsophila vaccaria]
MDPLPTVNQAFSKVHQAEFQKNITDTVFAESSDAVAMAVHKSSDGGSSKVHLYKQPPNTWKRDYNKSRGEKPSYYCDYCHKHGHTRDFCYKLKGVAKYGDNSGGHKPAFSTGKRYAAHVEETSVFEADTPFDNTVVPQSSFVEASVDPNLVQAVMK